MFNVICEKVGLTKSNLRTIWRIWNIIKYPPPDWHGNVVEWVISFTCSFLLVGIVLTILGTSLREVPVGSILLWMLVAVAFLTWATRWCFYGIPRIIRFTSREAWNKLPEGRKKKKRGKQETREYPAYPALLMDESGEVHMEPPPPKDLDLSEESDAGIISLGQFHIRRLSK